MRARGRLRAYRLLLRLFPKSFRDACGRQMERLFLDMCARREEEGKGLGAAFWAFLIWDASREAIGAWLSLVDDGTGPESAHRKGEIVSDLMTDARFALRQLARQPTYALTIVMLVTLGVAGNAAMFRVFNGLFLRPLPFEESDRLVDLDETAPTWDLEYLKVAYRDFHDWREQNSTFQAMAAYDFAGGNLVAEGGARRITFLATTHDMDDVLGIEPIVGRFFAPEEDVPGGPAAGLLTRGFWEQEFAADPAVLGRSVSVNGRAVEIVGVLPAEASFFGEADMWLPLQQDRSTWQGWGLTGIGRLLPGVTVEQARADLTTVHKGMIPEFEVNEISSPVVSGLRERYLGGYRLGSGFLLGAVGVVLLIACANIAGLMLARAMARAPEIDVRLAMGAQRGRIVRQLLTESFMLAAIGALLGTLLGVWGSNAFIAPMADQFPRWISFDVDGRFVAFTLLVTGGAALLFGLAPALRAARTPSSVAAGGRGGASVTRKRAMGALVTGEVTLAFALLVVGGLTLLDVHQLADADPGLQAEGLITYRVNLPSTRYANGEERLAFTSAYLERLRAIPGVEAATVASSLPLSGHWGWFFIAEGAPPRAEDEANPVVLNRVVAPGYFETTGVRLAAGRTFDGFDGREEAGGVVIVNETFVRTHLAHVDDPIGARVAAGTDAPDESEWWTVVGVARDVKHYGLDEPMRPGVYQPLQQLPLGSFLVALRATGDAEPVVAAARGITSELDAELPIYGVASLSERFHDALWTRRATSWLIGGFATVALLLALAGIYGVISYGVSQRAREISIRMAVGARRSDVLRQIVRQGMTLVAIGVVLGLGTARAGASLVSGILVGVPATDARVYAAMSALVLAVAWVANLLPARRAAALDPMKTLGRE